MYFTLNSTEYIGQVSQAHRHGTALSIIIFKRDNSFLKEIQRPSVLSGHHGVRWGGGGDLQVLLNTVTGTEVNIYVNRLSCCLE